MKLVKVVGVDWYHIVPSGLLFKIEFAPGTSSYYVSAPGGELELPGSRFATKADALAALVSLVNDAGVVELNQPVDVVVLGPDD